MGIFSEIIRGIIADEMKAMLEEEKKPEELKTEEKLDDLRETLRKEIRGFMAENLNGESAIDKTITAEDALKSVLGFGEKEE